MSINRYFASNYGSNADQSLLEDLLIEAIRCYGIDIIFVPYDLVNPDGLYGEDTLMEYKRAYDLEAYVEHVTGWEGQNDFIAKFGIQIEEKGNLLISMRRFRHAVGHTLYRPREKDMIYFPLTDSIYEITFVEHEKPFHQLGTVSNALYSLRIDLFNYSNQRIRTGVREIDRFENERAFAVDFRMDVGSGRYLIGEWVYQGNDLSSATAKAMCIHYERHHKVLKVKDLVGDFDNTLPIKGATSGVVYTIASFDNRELKNDPVADNKQIHDSASTGANPVVDWTPDNPFGTGKD